MAQAISQVDRYFGSSGSNRTPYFRASPPSSGAEKGVSPFGGSTPFDLIQWFGWRHSVEATVFVDSFDFFTSWMYKELHLMPVLGDL